MRIAAIFIGVVALTTWIVVINIRGRRRERLVREQRGVQSAQDFAALFKTPTQRFIAERLFPYLQMATFTKQFSFSKDDRLWAAPLAFVQDDFEDNLEGFWHQLDLGLTAEGQEFSQNIFSAETVGELVERIGSIYEGR